jgi:uncharacterized membrane protein YgdD (TMEM256/DUF423 family)
MRVWIGIAGLAGLSGVAMGAFAAHGLKHVLAPEQLQTLQIGVQYQLWHALALLLVVVLGQLQPSRWLRAACWAFALGMLLFSGSLYLLVLAQLPLGVVTPLGGLALMSGWGALLAHGCRAPGDKPLR